MEEDENVLKSASAKILNGEIAYLCFILGDETEELESNRSAKEMKKTICYLATKPPTSRERQWGKKPSRIWKRKSESS